MIGHRIPLYCLFLLLFLPTLTHAKIVFKSYRDGSKSLYVMDDDGSNVQRLTASPGWWPEWSPDGKQIAFTAKPPGVPNWPQIRAIYIINSDGTDEYRLTDEDTRERGPTWSPDGKYIAFESNRLAEPGVGQIDIWRITLETKALRRLTRAREDEWYSIPSWSPDGKYIAYQDGGGIYLILADGRRPQRLGRGERPDWSPDSQSIVSHEDIHDANGEFITSKVVIHNINTGKRQILDTPDKWLIHSTCFMGPKQVLIAARHWDKNNPNRDKFDIHSYHLMTREIVNLTNTPGDDDFAMDWISDDVLSVSPKGDPKKVTVTWGEMKK